MAAPRFVIRSGEYRCSSCANKVVQKSATSTTIHARGPIAFDSDGRCRFRCRTCGGSICVPLAMQPGRPVDSGSGE